MTGPGDERARGRDPLAHRRDEPRVFALCWTMFLLVAVVGSALAMSGPLRATPGGYAPSARIMLIVIGVGITVLWPMVRLSQSAPKRTPASWAMWDFVIVTGTAQLVVWPLSVLAGWAPSVVAAVATMLTAWAAFSAGVLSVFWAGELANVRFRPPRWLWMLVLMLIVLGAPIAVTAWRAPPGTAMMLSPATGVGRITGQGVAGPREALGREEWAVMGVVGGAGAVMMLTSMALSAVAERRRG